MIRTMHNSYELVWSLKANWSWCETPHIFCCRTTAPGLSMKGVLPSSWLHFRPPKWFRASKTNEAISRTEAEQSNMKKGMTLSHPGLKSLAGRAEAQRIHSANSAILGFSVALLAELIWGSCQVTSSLSKAHPVVIRTRRWMSWPVVIPPHMGI